MKILIVSPCFGAFGGIEAFVCALARALGGHADAAVTLCFKKAKGFRLDALLEKNAADTGAPVCFVERSSRALAEAIRQADIVHCQNPCIDVAALAKLFRKPLALTIHNYRQPGSGLRELLRLAAFKLADRRWYNSNFVWETWEGNRKRPGSARLPVLSNLPAGIVPVPERKGFVFVARWIPNKGLDLLVEAYAAARLDRARWPLILVGDGPLRPAIEEKIRNEKIDGILLKGRVDEAERNDLIRHARWMVTPPHTKEDLGLTPIEARHVGVPCIITRDGGLPEAGGRHALVCTPGSVEELRALLETAAAMGEQDYEALCEATRRELLESLQPLSVYLGHYRELLAEP
jgi:glycosyltransferase involved in cell wall biosynthesis